VKLTTVCLFSPLYAFRDRDNFTRTFMVTTSQACHISIVTEEVLTLFRKILAVCDSGKFFICANRISNRCKPRGSLKSLRVNNQYINNDKINVPGLQKMGSTVRAF